MMSASPQREVIPEERDGDCPAEQLTEHDRAVRGIDVPAGCSLNADHDGPHEMWVTYSFSNGRPSYRARAWSWTDEEGGQQ